MDKIGIEWVMAVSSPWRPPDDLLSTQAQWEQCGTDLQHAHTTETHSIFAVGLIFLLSHRLLLTCSQLGIPGAIRPFRVHCCIKPQDLVMIKKKTVLYLIAQGSHAIRPLMPFSLGHRTIWHFLCRYVLSWPSNWVAILVHAIILPGTLIKSDVFIAKHQ